MPSANGTDGAWTRYLINSSSEASVSTTGWQVGGLAGCISDRSTYGGTDKYMGAVVVRNCYATGDVTGQQYVGGLIGWGANVKEGEIHKMCIRDSLMAVSLQEAQIESLIIAKGYTDCVAYMTDDGINVAVAAPAEGLQDADVALLADVVTGQSDYQLADIHIIEVK